ncbi:GNAT family N-acetyltransferase [uncultured Thiodictyon sp.]|uniref:GNAT family N-acetyltransferase n=1 Tax=uncultured Thiodictyon sp. TaxID=1846217 RepID=UPI0025FE859F|nr:GNAT family N-acetyltransferase [uncultured Thiodictyon sp.]
MDITYLDDAKLTVEAAIDLYRRSTLGERRPLDRPDIFAGMIDNASLTVTAWHDERLVGIARTLTDFTYVAYLADLAVDRDYQRLGIGKRLIQETKQRLGSECMIVLLAAPRAHAYYSKLGFEPNPRGWMLKGS